MHQPDQARLVPREGLDPIMWMKRRPRAMIEHERVASVDPHDDAASTPRGREHTIRWRPQASPFDHARRGHHEIDRQPIQHRRQPIEVVEIAMRERDHAESADPERSQCRHDGPRAHLRDIEASAIDEGCRSAMLDDPR